MSDPKLFQSVDENSKPTGEGWVSLKDSTPAEGSSVFIFSPGGIAKAEATYRDGKFFNILNEELDRITHWMAK